MDEWVPLNRIDVVRGAVEDGAKGPGYGLDSLNGRERKLTRNLKRKHDEINHVQKVRKWVFGDGNRYWKRTLEIRMVS